MVHGLLMWESKGVNLFGVSLISFIEKNSSPTSTKGKVKLELSERQSSLLELDLGLS